MFTFCVCSSSSSSHVQTCHEMYHADSEEKRRKSLLGNTTCLETITEGRQQRSAATEQLKLMKSKGVQVNVSRNFEDSLRRYPSNPVPQRSKSVDLFSVLSKISTSIHSVVTIVN